MNCTHQFYQKARKTFVPFFAEVSNNFHVLFVTALLGPFRRSRLRTSSSLTHRVLPTHTFAIPPRNRHDRGIVHTTRPATTRQTMGHGYYSTPARPPVAGRTFIRRSWRNDHDAFQDRLGSVHRTTRLRLCRHHDRRASQ